MIKALIRLGSKYRMQVSDFINSGSEFFGCVKHLSRSWGRTTGI